jgi:hypothetical protein
MIADQQARVSAGNSAMAAGASAYGNQLTNNRSIAEMLMKQGNDMLGRNLTLANTAYDRYRNMNTDYNALNTRASGNLSDLSGTGGLERQDMAMAEMNRLDNWNRLVNSPLDYLNRVSGIYNTAQGSGGTTNVQQANYGPSWAEILMAATSLV